MFILCLRIVIIYFRNFFFQQPTVFFTDVHNEVSESVYIWTICPCKKRCTNKVHWRKPKKCYKSYKWNKYHSHFYKLSSLLVSTGIHRINFHNIYSFCILGFSVSFLLLTSAGWRNVFSFYTFDKKLFHCTYSLEKAVAVIKVLKGKLKMTFLLWIGY